MISDRAATNQIWMIAANAVGWQEKGGYQFWGGSGVWAPSGIKVVEASHVEEELIVVKNLPIEKCVESERKKFSYADDFKKVYRPVPNNCCNPSCCCSAENCCGSFTRFK
jgi:predicted amidohydrolase